MFSVVSCLCCVVLCCFQALRCVLCCVVWCCLVVWRVVCGVCVCVCGTVLVRGVLCVVWRCVGQVAHRVRSRALWCGDVVLCGGCWLRGAGVWQFRVLSFVLCVCVLSCVWRTVKVLRDVV